MGKRVFTGFLASDIRYPYVTNVYHGGEPDFLIAVNA